MSDLTAERLAAVLSPRKFKFYEEIGSTNDVAREWATQGAPAGSVVLAEVQTQGRGRFRRQWTAPSGTALLTSTILRPLIEPAQFSRITMLGAVAVAETLEALASAQVAIKWPNDVYLMSKKVAGILPEVEWRGNYETCEFVILGIGLNVRVDFSGTALQDTAVSIETVTARSVDRVLLLNNLLQRIDYWSRRLSSPELWNMWRGWLSTLGQRVRATTIGNASKAAGREISGQAVDVDATGNLLIRDDDDTIHRVAAGEVTLSL